MKSKLVAGIIAGIMVAIMLTIIVAIIAGVIAFTSPKLEKTEPKDPFENLNRSGPFAINKKEYKLGESIFISVNGLTTNDVGKIIFGLPNGTTIYSTIPFDGAMKSEFNTYFKPSLSKSGKICSTEDLVGEWIVVFKDTKYKPLTFKIINETLDSEATNYAKIC